MDQCDGQTLPKTCAISFGISICVFKDPSFFGSFNLIPTPPVVFLGTELEFADPDLKFRFSNIIVFNGPPELSRMDEEFRVDTP